MMLVIDHTMLQIHKQFALEGQISTLIVCYDGYKWLTEFCHLLHDQRFGSTEGQLICSLGIMLVEKAP